MKWTTAFSQTPSLRCLENGGLVPAAAITDIVHLKQYLEFVHVKYCLLKPFRENKAYPLVDARDLLPSFEPSLYEFAELPGFSLVAFDRRVDYFNEIFQFDLLHTAQESDPETTGAVCVLEDALHRKNQETFLQHLSRELREQFEEATAERPLFDLASYSFLIDFLGHMDRAHVLSKNQNGAFHLSGIYASLPSDLDTEIKRFGLKSRKFKANDNKLYERNRTFVYQFLMELYGYPISSERKTSAAIFARRLHKMGERFLIKVLGQSDRTLTTLFSTQSGAPYPQVEKVALVSLDARNRETFNQLEQDGFFVDPKKRVLILRVTYRQHQFDANNVRQDRALSVALQEIIHPLTGQACSSINIMKDSYSMSLKLNDIVRGEFSGRVLYRNGEVVENTESHENRLKFLYAWLTKHQRRMIGYSDEFYKDIAHVLDGYLLNPDLQEDFSTLNDLYQEVRSSYSYIKQARNIKILEDLSRRDSKGKKIKYKEALTLSTALLTDLKFEFINYFEPLFHKAIHFADAMLNDAYLVRTYISQRDELLTEYGRGVKKNYRRLVSLVDELKAIRKTKPEA